MNRKHIAIMLCCAAVVYACAPRNRSATDSETPSQPVSVERTADSARGLALTISENDEHGMSFALELKNPGDKLTEVRFANGKTHDFVVLNDRDQEVWRWSDGRLFTQTLQTKQLQRDEAVRFTATWDTAAPGRYRLVASLNSDSYDTPIEQEFVVPR
jgi:hypothetical protein